MNRKFGNTIKRQRIRLGYGLTEIANVAGMSESYLSLLELGKRSPPVDAKITALADWLVIDRDKLFFAANRLPPDAQILVQRYPEAVTKFVRKSLK